MGEHAPGLAPRPFTQPPGLLSIKIDPTTGLLAPPPAGQPSLTARRFVYVPAIGPPDLVDCVVALSIV